jgi:DNA-binding CsgD family transcriptional regulator
MLGQPVDRSSRERDHPTPTATTLVRAITALNIAVALLFADGSLAWASSAARDVVECEDQAPDIKSFLRRIARAVPVSRSPNHPPVTRRTVELHLRRNTYRLVAASLNAAPAEPSVAVAFSEVRTDRADSVDALRQLHGLTLQQARVAKLLIQGRSNASIAAHLGVKLSTARSHVEHVRRKLGVRTRAQVVARLVAESDDDPQSTQ